MAKSEANGMYKLCRLSYWSRVWVVQELLLSSGRGRGKTFLYGNAQCHGLKLDQEVRQSSRSWQCDKSATLLDPNETSRARMLCDACYRAKQKSQDSLDVPMETHEDSLIALLELSQDSRCSDFHDRLYALLPLYPRRSMFNIHYG